jgi:hypothetical protein
MFTPVSEVIWAMHVFAGSKAPWWEITDGLPQHEKWVPGFGPKLQS